MVHVFRGGRERVKVKDARPVDYGFVYFDRGKDRGGYNARSKAPGRTLKTPTLVGKTNLCSET